MSKSTLYGNCDSFTNLSPRKLKNVNHIQDAVDEVKRGKTLVGNDSMSYQVNNF